MSEYHPSYEVLPSGCWEWQGATQNMGYGHVWNGEKVVLAHRFFYERDIGPIPKGLVIDHLCRNSLCVNPSHLEPVTQAENVRRGNSGKHNAIKTHCPQGHPYDAENTYVNPNTGRRYCRPCQRAHNRAYKRRKAERV